jgi:hypothetical protein
MGRFCGPDARDPLGGSSQFKCYPYLRALSNPKKSLRRPPHPPPCAPPQGAAARRGQNGGYYLLQGGGDLDLSHGAPALRDGAHSMGTRVSPPVLASRGVRPGGVFARVVRFEPAPGLASLQGRPTASSWLFLQ